MYNAEVISSETGNRILAVDWGSKRIGVAVSDPSGLIARPIGIIHHISRIKDAEKIVEIARENYAEKILVGVTYDDDNNLTPNGRSAARLGEVISSLFGKPIITWDEAFTTKDASQLQTEKGIPHYRRKGHNDEIAAALMLQNYLDNKNQ